MREGSKHKSADVEIEQQPGEINRRDFLKVAAAYVISPSVDSLEKMTKSLNQQEDQNLRQRLSRYQRISGMRCIPRYVRDIRIIHLE